MKTAFRGVMLVMFIATVGWTSGCIGGGEDEVLDYDPEVTAERSEEYKQQQEEAMQQMQQQMQQGRRGR